MRPLCFLLLTFLLVSGFPAASVLGQSQVMRIGIVGCDTSHVIAFTRLINAPDTEGPLSRMKVVAAFPGGSPDVSSSADRVQGFTEQLREMGIEIVEDLPDLVPRCDAFLLESVDGRVHWSQFRTIAVGKPVFIDKPAAASLADLLAIRDHGRETDTPWFTASALRFCDQVQGLRQQIDQGTLGALASVETSSPYKTEPHHPDLFWYGIHGVESLFTLMGPDCRSVTCIEGKHCVATGDWSDDRLGTFRGIRTPTNSSAYRFTVYGAEEIRSQEGFSGYAGLVQEIAKFFESRQPPVAVEETLQMFAFMEAAQESRKRGGQAVELSWAMRQATARLKTLQRSREQP